MRLFIFFSLLALAIAHPSFSSERRSTRDSEEDIAIDRQIPNPNVSFTEQSKEMLAKTSPEILKEIQSLPKRESLLKKEHLGRDQIHSWYHPEDCPYEEESRCKLLDSVIRTMDVTRDEDKTITWKFTLPKNHGGEKIYHRVAVTLNLEKFKDRML